MSVQYRCLSAIGIISLTATVSACAERTERAPVDTPETVQGECSEVFGGEICTWGTFAGDRLVEFGATVPMTTVENAPLEGEMEFPPPLLAAVRLPDRVKAAAGVDHLGVNWEPHGHPPGPYMTPHFDFHFYAEPEATIAAIDCSDLSKPTATADGYDLPDMDIPGLGELVGLCVPSMGMHAMPTAEFEGTDPFGATMILGYYGGDLIHFEPMISRDKLMSEQTFGLTMPSVPSTGPVTTWPAGFEAAYDSTARTYRFVFSAPTSGD